MAPRRLAAERDDARAPDLEHGKGHFWDSERGLAAVVVHAAQHGVLDRVADKAVQAVAIDGRVAHQVPHDAEDGEAGVDLRENGHCVPAPVRKGRG